MIVRIHWLAKIFTCIRLAATGASMWKSISVGNLWECVCVCTEVASQINEHYHFRDATTISRTRQFCATPAPAEVPNWINDVCSLFVSLSLSQFCFKYLNRITIMIFALIVINVNCTWKWLNRNEFKSIPFYYKHSLSFIQTMINRTGLLYIGRRITAKAKCSRYVSIQ
jgi:hypothetical protein